MYIYTKGQRIGISCFLPKNWVTGECTLTYTIFRVKFPDNRKEEEWTTLINDFYFLLIYGKVEYSSKYKIVDFPIEAKVNLEFNSTIEDWFLLIFLYEKDNKYQNLKSEILNRSISSLVNMFIGYGATFENIITNSNIFIFTGYRKNFSYKGNVKISPLNLKLDNPNRRFNDEYFLKLAYSMDLLLSLEPKKRNRSELGLNWYMKGISEDEVNSLISLWTAIECIAIDEGTSIKPIKEILSHIYKIKIEDVEDKFGIGKIFKLRSEIIHNGFLPTEISFNLLRYVGCIFIDLFFYKLELDSERRIELYCALMNFEINKELSKFEIFD